MGIFNFEIDWDYSACIKTDYGAVEVSSVANGGSDDDDDVGAPSVEPYLFPILHNHFHYTTVCCCKEIQHIFNGSYFC